MGSTPGVKTPPTPDEPVVVDAGEIVEGGHGVGGLARPFLEIVIHYLRLPISWHALNVLQVHVTVYGLKVALFLHNHRVNQSKAHE
jgi:hypothetical protein